MASRRALACLTGACRPIRAPFASFHNSPRHSAPKNDTSVSQNASSSEILSLQDLDTLLSKPTWSVESLLPPKSQAADAPKISAQQLHHLLRLSALPLPKSAEEEHKMLGILSAQLHFVGEIQQVDTMGVKPLRAIRDETAAAEQEQTITLETLKDAFAKGKVIGKHYKRIQRDTTPVDAKDAETWDVLESAERKVGKYFVVESERPQE